MSKIIGTANSSFKGNDGTQITGTTVYTTEPIDPKRGQGESADHFFLSAAKLAALDFTPAVGQDVTVFYNRYGKVATIKLNDEVLDLG